MLARSSSEIGRNVRFNAEARAAYLLFAKSGEAPWSGNFRDLAASVTRLATLAEGGRISVEQVQAEISRLQWLWQHAGGDAAALVDDAVDLADVLTASQLEQLDCFDRLQLECVVRICRQSRTLSEAGRRLFDKSRTQKAVVNDADRLRKYLHKFGLNWDALNR